MNTLSERLELDAVDRRERRSATLARATTAIDLFFGALYAMFAFDIVVHLGTSWFGKDLFRLLGVATGPFLVPIRALVPKFALVGSYVIGSCLVAIFAYALLHAGVRAAMKFAPASTRTT